MEEHLAGIEKMLAHPEAKAALSKHAPEWRDLAQQVRDVDPELSKQLLDMADGKAESLENYEGLINDAQAAIEFSRRFDAAIQEAGAEGTSELDNQPRPSGSQAGPATQAPELKSKSTLKNPKPHKP